MSNPCPEVVPQWWNWHPPIGIFIAVLALVGVLVPWIRGSEVKRNERAFWTILMFALVLLEIRSIYLDQDQHDQEQSLSRCQQLESFGQIANTLRQAITGGQAQFQATIEKINGVLDLTRVVAGTSKTNLDAISGEGSIPCVVPESHAVADGKIPFVLWNKGKNNLTGVEVRFLSTRQFDTKAQMEAPTVSLGTVHPVWPRMLPGLVPEMDTLEGEGIGHYQVQIWTQNGFYTEEINFRPGKYSLPWAFQYWLDKAVKVDGTTKGIPHSVPKGTLFALPDQRCSSPQWSDDLGDGKPNPSGTASRGQSK